MKTKLFKRIGLFGLSALAAFTLTPSVQAGEQCTTHTNYYLFSDVGNRSSYDTNQDWGYPYDSNGGFWYHNTAKTFNLGIPAAATNINHGMISFKQSGASGVDQMNVEEFYNKFKVAGDNEAYTSDGGLTNYIRAVKWWDEGEEKDTYTDFPATFSEFNVAPLGSNGQYANAEITVSDVIANRSSFDFHINRKWYESDLVGYNNNSYTFTPAAYYIQYQLCNSTPDTPKYYAIVKYYYENTTKPVEFKNASDENPYERSHLDDGYEENKVSPEAANTSCKPLEESVPIKIEGKDFEHTVYYRCSTFNATIHYCIEQADGTCTPATDVDKNAKDYTKTGLANGTKVSKESYTIKNCKLKNDDDKTVVRTINNSDIDYTVRYICGDEAAPANPKTGIALIITAWTVGLGALGYSAYYFMNAKKEENAEL